MQDEMRSSSSVSSPPPWHCSISFSPSRSRVLLLLRLRRTFTPRVISPPFQKNPPPPTATFAQKKKRRALRYARARSQSRVSYGKLRGGGCLKAKTTTRKRMWILSYLYSFFLICAGENGEEKIAKMAHDERRNERTRVFRYKNGGSKGGGGGQGKGSIPCPPPPPGVQEITHFALPERRKVKRRI